MGGCFLRAPALLKSVLRTLEVAEAAMGELPESANRRGSVRGDHVVRPATHLYAHNAHRRFIQEATSCLEIMVSLQEHAELPHLAKFILRVSYNGILSTDTNEL